RHVSSCFAMPQSRKRRHVRMRTIVTSSSSAEAHAATATPVAKAICASEENTGANARAAPRIEVALPFLSGPEREAPLRRELDAARYIVAAHVGGHEPGGEDVLDLAAAGGGEGRVGERAAIPRSGDAMRRRPRRAFEAREIEVVAQPVLAEVPVDRAQHRFSVAG